MGDDAVRFKLVVDQPLPAVLRERWVEQKDTTEAVTQTTKGCSDAYHFRDERISLSTGYHLLTFGNKQEPACVRMTPREPSSIDLLAEDDIDDFEDDM